MIIDLVGIMKNENYKYNLLLTYKIVNNVKYSQIIITMCDVPIHIIRFYSSYTSPTYALESCIYDGKPSKIWSFITTFECKALMLLIEDYFQKPIQDLF